MAIIQKINAWKISCVGLMMSALEYGNTSKMITCHVYIGADKSCTLFQQ